MYGADSSKKTTDICQPHGREHCLCTDKCNRAMLACLPVVGVIIQRTKVESILQTVQRLLHRGAPAHRSFRHQTVPTIDARRCMQHSPDLSAVILLDLQLLQLRHGHSERPMLRISGCNMQ